MYECDVDLLKSCNCMGDCISGSCRKYVQLLGDKETKNRSDFPLTVLGFGQKIGR